MSVKKYKFVCSLDFGDVLVQTLIWVVLIVCTLGLALPFFAYFFLRLIINKTEIHEISEEDQKRAADAEVALRARLERTPSPPPHK